MPIPSCDEDPAIHTIFANASGIMHHSWLHCHIRPDSGLIAGSPPQNVISLSRYSRCEIFTKLPYQHNGTFLFSA